MKIHIQDSLYIESDSRQYIVKEYTGKHSKETGEELYKVHGYYGSLVQAANKIIKMKIDQSTAKNLSELVQDIQRIEQEVKSLIKY
jgi:hypothetical protein